MDKANKPVDNHPELGFKFSIGEMVATVGYVPPEPEPVTVESAAQDEVGRRKFPAGSWGRALEEWNGPAKFFIIERQIVECPGGVQRLYTARPMSANGHTTERWFKFNEIELKAAE